MRREAFLAFTTLVVVVTASTTPPVGAQLEPLTGWAQSGRVEIAAVHGWGIAVGIDLWQEKAPPDGVVDRVYLLQAYGPKPAEMPWVLERATVLETETGLRVVAEAEKLDVRLEIASGDAVFAPGGLGEDGIYRYKGFGLSRRDGLRWEQPLEAAFLFAYPPVDSRSPAAESCDSGGEGATSCSVTNRVGGCSVTCSTGYYACCTNSGLTSEADCSCVASPTSGGGGAGGGGSWGGGGVGGGGGICFIGPVGFCPISCMACIPY